MTRPVLVEIDMPTLLYGFSYFIISTGKKPEMSYSRSSSYTTMEFDFKSYGLKNYILFLKV